MAESSINWAAIDSDPRFQRLHTKKTAFLMGMMVFSLIYYWAYRLPETAVGKSILKN